MGMSWGCHGDVMGMPWECHGNAMGMSWDAMMLKRMGCHGLPREGVQGGFAPLM
jgi:hypothetical protein